MSMCGCPVSPADEPAHAAAFTGLRLAALEPATWVPSPTMALLHAETPDRSHLSLLDSVAGVHDARVPKSLAGRHKRG